MTVFMWAPAGLYFQTWHALSPDELEPAQSVCRAVGWWGLVAEELRRTPGGRPCLPCLLAATVDLAPAPAPEWLS